jgi:hypothetical protein
MAFTIAQPCSGARVPACPVTAIFPNDDVPEQGSSFTDKNADRYRLSAADFQAKWNEPGKAYSPVRMGRVNHLGRSLRCVLFF